MKDSFAKLHPIVLLTYFVLQAILTAICFHPITLGISLICALVFTALSVSPSSTWRWICISVIYMVCFGAVNPLINNQGDTVLFLLFGKAITLQSVCYGLLTGEMVSSMCLWMYLMGKTVDSKKAVCLFGKTMPVVTLMVFMSIRMVRRYQQKVMEIFESRKGIYRSESQIYLMKETAGTLFTFGLENGVDTADSMSSRGYGCHKPTAYYDFAFTNKDIFSAVVLLVSALIIVFGIFTGCCKMYFFPKFFVENVNPLVFAAYFIFCAFPFFCYIWSEIKWAFLR